MLRRCTTRARPCAGIATRAHLYSPRERKVLVRNSHRPFWERFWARVALDSSGCWLWGGLRDVDGYGRLGRGAGCGTRARAHRLAYEAAHGPILPGFCVLHRCDTPACVNPAHLFLGTQLDNVADRDAKGRTRVPIRRGGRWTGKHRAVAS